MAISNPSQAALEALACALFVADESDKLTVDECAPLAEKVYALGFHRSGFDYYDPARQNLISEHDCDFEDGQWWFGYGMPCKHPELHSEPKWEYGVRLHQDIEYKPDENHATYTPPTTPHPTMERAVEMARLNPRYKATFHRRRKAGPWEPVSDPQRRNGE